MAEILTIQQKQAVYDRGGKLLVSAAAGSGKTKVLVDRLMRYVMDEKDPANLDDFLLITYTKAAASELRGKIAAKLTEHIAEHPENRHLQQQMQRLYLAKISTVHSFCSDILREYAYELDLSADSRVADENECRELRDRTVSRILDEAYDDPAGNTFFRAFVDTQGLGRTDALVPEIILQVYDSARCHLDPVQWLESCIAGTQVTELDDASQTVWGQFLVNDLFAYLDMQIEAMECCADMAAREKDWAKPAALLQQTLTQLRYLRSSSTWDEIVARREIDYGRMVISSKKGDQSVAARIKAVREACRKGLKKKLESFSDPSNVILRDLAQSAPAVRGLVDLVFSFSDAYDRAKRSRRILDFGDLEHRMLDLVLGRSRSFPTIASREIGRRFREIMVDEYQDSNAVQDAIFDALTKEKDNLFMVGDVKQSIYQFRLADPEIFLKKYEAYLPAADAKPGQGRKVLLSSNFRSAGGMISAVNHVFTSTMSPNVGGLAYTEAEALREGIPHVSIDEPEVELHALSVQDSAYPEEAAFTANRISELLDGTHMVRQGDGLRPIRPEDIVILLRSPGSVGSYFETALAARGIRCVSGGGEDLLQTAEIGTLRAILQIISNPRQDIPLIAALMSPVFGFTADDMAAMRGKCRSGSIYDALCLDESAKSRTFLDTLNLLRRKARMCSLSQLVDQIFLLTKMDSLFAAMPDGAKKEENLQLFSQLCADFESVSRRDLDHFLDHLQILEEKGLVSSGEQSSAGAVTIMSIHKSKGLEFPVVFLCGLSREFNRESLRGQVLCHKELGLGMSCADRKNRIRYPAISKRAIMVRSMQESLSEELRVLYVALTRARDRLIMTYTAKNLKNDISDIALRMDFGNKELLTGSFGNPGKWVLMAALRKTEAGALFDVGDRPAETFLIEPVWKICVSEHAADIVSRAGAPGRVQSIPTETINRIREGLSYEYPYVAATKMPSKQTATQRKGRLKDQEAAEHAQPQQEWHRVWRKAGFSASESSGVAYGNAMHAVMQYISFEACQDAQAVKQEVQRLCAERYITEDQKKICDCDAIAAFFSSELGRKMREGDQLLREFKFSILDNASDYASGLEDEKVLLQGVVDCALIEADGITIVDFKTDRVTKDSLPSLTAHYRPQVETYAQALERIFEMPVKRKYLYFFRLNHFVNL